ncbi:MAG TPA: hypothetical protein VE863_15455 [Pyrinomonadaceae bacterium]|jgi:FlaG/FlaF family flagellin (archaellin)|nr:hypothetical protein [Pyrinomonadaceae bacterium]
MRIVNETQQQVLYNISAGSGGDCGTIDVDGLVDLPEWDNTANVTIQFATSDEQAFQITVDDTAKGEQVEMAVLAE